MSAEEPVTPSPPPLRLVLTAGGAVATIGRADFAPGEDERAITVPDDAYAAFIAVADALAEDEEVTYDEGAQRFGKRARAKSAAEQAEATEKGARATRLARLDSDITGWAGLSVAERQTATLNGLVLLRAVIRRLMGE